MACPLYATEYKGTTRLAKGEWVAPFFPILSFDKLG
jgi:hypothetical protein